MRFGLVLILGALAAASPATAQNVYQQQLQTMQSQHQQLQAQRLWHDHRMNTLRGEALRSAGKDSPEMVAAREAEIARLEAETARIEAETAALNTRSDALTAQNQALFDAMTEGSAARDEDFNKALIDFLEGGSPAQTGPSGDPMTDFYRSLLNN